MKHPQTNQVNRMGGTVSWWLGFVPAALSLSILLPSVVSHAAGFSAPKECRSSTGDAHLNCLYSYIETQQKHTGMIEADMNAQRDRLEHMREHRDQIDHSLSASEEEQGRPADRADTAQPAAVPTHPTAATTPGIRPPDECRAYSGAAHLNCLYAYIEIQQSKTGTVEEELRAQKQMLGQLRDQMDRQASASQDLQRRLAERDATPSTPAPAYVSPPIYPGYGYPGYIYPGFGYTYPPGLSLYLGVPGYYYGRPFYGPRFFGPRFYGHHHR